MSHVFIIAEAGVNHNGSMELAKKLVDVAASSGADAVKFQTFKAEKLLSKNAQKAEYQKLNTNSAESQFEMIKKLELSDEAHRELIDYCKLKEIEFLSTPFDLDSINLLNELGLSSFKIPSGEITNLPFLRAVGRLGKKIILSTGMSDLGEIEDALDILINSGTSIDKITILHATTEYPCPLDEVNLKAMITIRNSFGVKVGYSDHTLGIEIPIAAAALGANIIEKHFTLDRRMDGPDHKASLEPNELIAMVKAIRNISLAIGDGIKKPSFSERKNISIARKSIVSVSNIKTGDLFDSTIIAVKRPGNGISPMRWDEIIGTPAQRDYQPDELI